MSESETWPSFANYEVLKQIGKGAFGVVYKVRSKIDKLVYALKTIAVERMDKKTLANTLNEVRILCSVNHPNVVGYKEAFIRDKRVCVVMEFVGGGDLLDKIDLAKQKGTSLPEELVWRYAAQILGGLKVLHSLKIIHRDVKSANIFLSDDHSTAKLGDLNLAKVAKEDFASTQIGTPHYLAPEIWLNQRYDYRADIFSLGCVLYEMAALDVPFTVSSVCQLLECITKESAPRLPPQYSDELNEVVSRFMEKQPEKRPTVVQALAMVEGKAQLDTRATDADTSDGNILMKTITIPKSLTLLNRRLPRRHVGALGKPVIETDYDNFDFDADEWPDEEISSPESPCKMRVRSGAMTQAEADEMDISGALKQMCLNGQPSFRSERRLELPSMCSLGDSSHFKKISIKNIDCEVRGKARIKHSFGNSGDMFYDPLADK